MRILWICILLLSSGYLHTTSLAPGVFYEHLVQTNPYPLSLHFLTVDPQKVTIILEPAHSYYGNPEKTSHIAQRSHALAAVNGGFFDFGQKNAFRYAFIKLLEIFGIYHYYAFPVFCSKVQDTWYSLSNIKGALLGWNNREQKAVIDTIQTSWQLIVEGIEYPIKNMNKPYAKGPTLYTCGYGPTTPLRDSVTEIILDGPTIKAVVQGHGNTPIPAHGYVYCIESSPTSQPFRPGLPFTIKKIYTGGRSSTEWDSMEYLLGSTPLLLKDGTIPPSLYKKQTPFYKEQRPRTAVGILSNGTWIFLVADGYQATSKGLSLLEVAYYLKDRGCISAVNLDGDASSTMVIQNTVVNSPASEYGLLYGSYGERPVANALLILPKL